MVFLLSSASYSEPHISETEYPWGLHWQILPCRRSNLQLALQFQQVYLRLIHWCRCIVVGDLRAQWERMLHGTRW